MSTNASYAQMNAALAAAKRQMLTHGSIFLFGSALTAISYATSRNKGFYIICFGAIIFGGYRFFRGLYYYLSIKRSMKEVPNFSNYWETRG